MSASKDSLLDFNPIKKHVQENSFNVKQMLDEIKPTIQQLDDDRSLLQKRIIECKKRIEYAIKTDIPDTAEILKKNAAVRKGIELERDRRIREIDEMIAEIDEEIAAEESRNDLQYLERLEEEKQADIKRKEELYAQTALLFNRLDVDKAKTLKVSCAAIAEILKIGNQIIEKDTVTSISLQQEITSLKEKLALLQAEERRFSISAEQLHYLDPKNSNSTFSPRLNGGP